MQWNPISDKSSFTLSAVNLLWVSSDITHGKFSLVDKTREFGIIEVSTSEGYLGYSEVYLSLYTRSSDITQIVNRIANTLNGVRFENPSDIFPALRVPFLTRAGGYFNLACAIEMAVWDAWLKSRNAPPWIPSHNTARGVDFLVYGSGGSNLMNAEQVREEYLKTSSFFDGYKFRIGLRDPNTDLQKIKRVSSTANPGTAWMIDAIGEGRREMWSLQDSSMLIAMCLENGAYWYEEPFRVDQFDESMEVINFFPGFIATGEALSSELEIKSMSSVGNLGWLQLDVTHNTTFSQLVALTHGGREKKPKLALHSWGSILGYRQTFFTAVLFPTIKWIEKPIIRYEIDQFFPDPAVFDSCIIPTDCMSEMIRWFKRRDNLIRIDVKIND